MEKIHYYRQNLKEENGRTIHLLFKHSSKFYNKCLWTQTKAFESGKKYISWCEMRELLKEDENFKLLGEAISVSIIRNLDINYKNFFTNNKKTGNLNAPKFRYGKDFFISFFGIYITNKNIINIPLSKNFKERYGIESFKIKVTDNFVKKNKTIKQLRLHKDYVVYHYNNFIEPVKGDFKLGIDLGVDNLLSVFCDNPKAKNFIISGKNLKFLNYKFLTYNFNSEKRRNIIDNYFNRAVKYLSRYCKKYGVSHIVVGFFKDIKLKHKQRNFFYIPFLALRLKLRDMCNKYSIKIDFVEESYTSKACFLLNEEIKKKDNYYGYRKERGLHKIKGINISYNCDINGAGNILRKRFEVCDLVRKKCLDNPMKIF